MSNSLYQLYLNIGKINVPDKYEVLFGFNKSDKIGKSDVVRIIVRNKEDDMRTTWVVTIKELENCKMDFIKDHLEAMIDSLEEDE